MDGQIDLTDSLERTGVFVADVQAAAMQQAYRQRLNQNTNLFIKRHCDNTPERIGEFLADVQANARREALIGFLWRWVLIGGGCSIVVAVVEVALLPVSLVVSVLVALSLTVKNN